MYLDNPETPQILYRLEDKAPIKDYFIGRLIGAIALFLAMLVLPEFMSMLSFIGFLAISIPLGREFFNHQLKELELTDQYLSLVTGYKDEKSMINFAEIKSVEIIEKYKNRRRGASPIRKGETSTLLIHDETRHSMNYHPDTRCVILTNDGREIQLKARYFQRGQFAKFLSILQQAYNGFQYNLNPAKSQMSLNKQPQNQQVTNNQSNSQNNSQQNNQANLQPNKQVKISENEAKINQVIENNKKFLQDDLSIKRDLEANMMEVYQSVYSIRDAFDMSKMSNPKVIFQYKNPEGANVYILENDFHKDLDIDSIEIGKNLIDAAQKNLNVVETRVAYYQKINKELEKLKFQEHNRQKLQSVAANLKNLQDKNTNKSIDQSLTGMDMNIEEKVIADLENLSEKVRTLEDLENSIWLNEHISLFKNSNLG